jgi:trk system potassium uptake protein TrkA
MASALTAARNEVTLIDQDDEVVENVKGKLRAQVLLGDACAPDTLEEAGSLKADILIACTDGDEDNLVISLLAKRQFDVPKVVARVNDPDNRWLFTEGWGVDVAVSASSTLLSLIQEATGTSDTIGLVDLGRAGVRLIETTLTEGSLAAGKSLAEVRLPAGCLVTTVIRDGTAAVPGGDFTLQAGDEILVVSESATEAEIQAAFQRSAH